MSQFVGYVRKDEANGPATPNHDFARIERVLREGLAARSGYLQSVEIRNGPFWCAGVPVSSSGANLCVVRPEGLVGAVLGDPLMAEDADGAPAPAIDASVNEVVDALGSWQTGALRRSQGSFSAVAWNPRSTSLTLATDKLGIRPIFYKEEPDRFVFASTLRLLRTACGQAQRVDERGFAEFLFLAQPLGARTVLDGVWLLRPGEALRFDRSSTTERVRYFTLADVPRSSLPRDEALRELHAVFGRAVRRRLSSGGQEAFLSGGMDSRAVVAELVDQGQSVATFSASYPESPDDVVAEIVAEAFGTQHTTWRRSPSEQVHLSGAPFSQYAAEHFRSPRQGKVRSIWSGDGGSVMLGHVYLDEARTALAGQHITADLMRRLLPGIGGRRTRHLSPARLRELGDLAVEGLVEEFRSYEAAPPDRRLFMYYASNDQARHLHQHFESIETSKIDLLTPFFDAAFVSLVMSLPTAWFLRHAFYNDWIQRFRCRAGDLYWQSYPGHVPCPHTRPVGAGSDQWDPSWFQDSASRQRFRALASRLIHSNYQLSRPFVRRTLLHAASWLSLAGSSRLNYEISNAQRIVDALD